MIGETVELYLPHKKLKNVMFAVTDLETTSVDPTECRIIEVAAKKIDGLNRQWGTFHTYVRPGLYPAIPQFVRGLTRLDLDNDLWRSFPFIGAVRAEFLSFIKDCVLVVHARNYFDIHVIRRTFRPIVELPCVDTYYLAKALYPRLLNGYSLESVGRRIGVNDWIYHSALHDVEITRLILRQFIGQFRLKTWGDFEERVRVRTM